MCGPKIVPVRDVGDALSAPTRSNRDDLSSRSAHAQPNKSKRVGVDGVEPSAIEALLTFAEAARMLGISLRQFRRLVDGGKVAFVKVSERSPRVRPSDLRRFLDASAVKYSENQS